MRERAQNPVESTAQAAKRAGQRLAALPAQARSAMLSDLAAALEDPKQRATIEEANAADVEAARAEAAAGRLAQPLVHRLGLDDSKFASLTEGLRLLAAQGDALGSAKQRRELDEGLLLEQVVAPLGVVGVVFESRPDALVQIAGLGLRTGNAVLLKGGSEALRSNRALTSLIHGVLAKHGLPAETVVLFEGREEVAALLDLDHLVDLIVARGSASFVRSIQSSSRIPVMGHAAGLCHLYLHASADPAMAARVALDAKCSYPSACNSAETLLWDAEAGPALDAAIAALSEAGVELRGDEATRSRHPALLAATEADWEEEYGAKILAIRQVSGIDEALGHIERYGSRHTEAIIADEAAAASRFLQEVDAGCVFHNASTRFADGFRFGLGAEVGVSTDKLHARGPVGVGGLTTYRWLLRGQGQAASEYGPEGRSFTHRLLDS